MDRVIKRARTKPRTKHQYQSVDWLCILFSPENDNLEEKTNREGFIENTAFMQVKATLATIFKNLGRKDIITGYPWIGPNT